MVEDPIESVLIRSGAGGLAHKQKFYLRLKAVLVLFRAPSRSVYALSVPELFPSVLYILLHRFQSIEYVSADIMDTYSNSFFRLLQVATGLGWF